MVRKYCMMFGVGQVVTEVSEGRQVLRFGSLHRLCDGDCAGCAQDWDMTRVQSVIDVSSLTK